MSSRMPISSCNYESSGLFYFFHELINSWSKKFSSLHGEFIYSTYYFWNKPILIVYDDESLIVSFHNYLY